MYEPPLSRGVSERSTPPSDAGGRLSTIRTGRFADAASAIAWLVGAAATAVHPAGLAVAGFALGAVATSVERAVATGASFGIVAAAAGVVWFAITGSLPPTAGFDPAVVFAAALLGPTTVAAIVRALG